MCGGFAFFLEQTRSGGGKVRARLPAKPMNSVSVREPRSGRSGKDDPGGGKVRAPGVKSSFVCKFNSCIIVLLNLSTMLRAQIAALWQFALALLLCQFPLIF